jgi:hypothetical protein
MLGPTAWFAKRSMFTYIWYARLDSDGTVPAVDSAAQTAGLP